MGPAPALISPSSGPASSLLAVLGIARAIMKITPTAANGALANSMVSLLSWPPCDDRQPSFPIKDSLCSHLEAVAGGSAISPRQRLWLKPTPEGIARSRRWSMSGLVVGAPRAGHSSPGALFALATQRGAE